MTSLRKAGVEQGTNGLTVEMLPDEHQLLHAVAIMFVPIATELGIGFEGTLQLVLGHGGKPLSAVLEAHLASGLLEKVAGVGLIDKIADALGTDDFLGPQTCHELVESVDVERRTAAVDEGRDAVFVAVAVSFAMVMSAAAMPFAVVMVSTLGAHLISVFILLFVPFVVMMVMMMFILFTLLIVPFVMMVMMTFILVLFVMMMMVMMAFVLVLFVVPVVVLDGIDPCGGGGHAVEVEEVGMKDAVEVHVAIVAFHNLGFGLQGTQDFAGMG